jgi:hypothetical protein
MRLGLLIHKYLGLPDAADHTARLVEAAGVRTALDVGCGSKSVLSAFRPRVRTVGVDAHPAAVEAAKRTGLHDAYVTMDVLRDGLETVLAENGGARFDLVALYDVIEHLPKRRGHDLLEKCESLTNKYIILQTPNGFVEQGPEFGNEYQRHLSGWFPEDFLGLGYTVHGTSGTRYLVGYAAGCKWRVRGAPTLDVLLARALRADSKYRHAYNLVAVKDVRGVPARFPGRAAL